MRRFVKRVLNSPQRQIFDLHGLQAITRDVMEPGQNLHPSAADAD